MAPQEPWPVRVFTPIGRVLLIATGLLFVLGGYAFFEYFLEGANPGDQFHWLPYFFGLIAGCGIVWALLAWGLERVGVAVFNPLDNHPSNESQTEILLGEQEFSAEEE
jgi:hypothetical protein